MVLNSEIEPFLDLVGRLRTERSIRHIALKVQEPLSIPTGLVLMAGADTTYYVAALHLALPGLSDRVCGVHLEADMFKSWLKDKAAVQFAELKASQTLALASLVKASFAFGEISVPQKFGDDYLLKTMPLIFVTNDDPVVWQALGNDLSVFRVGEHSAKASQIPPGYISWLHDGGGRYKLKQWLHEFDTSKEYAHGN